MDAVTNALMTNIPNEFRPRRIVTVFSGLTGTGLQFAPVFVSISASGVASKAVCINGHVW